MGYIEVLLTGIALAMDAFAVSICKGIKMKKLKISHLVVIAIFFGGFQMLMPLIGKILGSMFVQFIEPVDHWIAFALLAFIGAKMAIESFKKDEEDECACCSDSGDKMDYKELLILAIATSIDALAVGITFAMYENINIVYSISIIGVVTFIICCGGVLIGHKFGVKFKSKAEFLGGVVLIAIGIKLLVEGLIA
jgi:putative Mn2+ efflux pump MntP